MLLIYSQTTNSLKNQYKNCMIYNPTHADY